MERRVGGSRYRWVHQGSMKMSRRGWSAQEHALSMPETELVDVRLLYFDGCPHWRLADARLVEAMRELGLTGVPERVLVETVEAAEAWHFHGSPSVLIDDADPFAEPDAPVGLACRLYRTPDGVQGAPSVVQLVQALTAASQ